MNWKLLSLAVIFASGISLIACDNKKEEKHTDPAASSHADAANAKPADATEAPKAPETTPTEPPKMEEPKVEHKTS